MLSKLHPRFIGTVIRQRYPGLYARLPNAFFNRGRSRVPQPVGRRRRICRRTTGAASRCPGSRRESGTGDACCAALG